MQHDHDHQFLTELKQQIINEVAPLIENTNLSATEKFNANYAVAQVIGSEESFNKAFEAAKLISDPNEKSNALLDLLDLVASKLDDSLGSEPEAQV